MVWGLKANTRPVSGTPKIPESISNSAILLFRNVPRGPVGSWGVLRGRWELKPNSNSKLGDRYIHEKTVEGVAKKGKQKAAPRIPKNPDSILNSAILPFRCVPWGCVVFRVSFRGGGH